MSDKTYMGKPCKHGHSGERYRSCHKCVECTHLRWVESSDTLREYHRHHYADNRDKILQRKRRYRVENSEKVRASIRRSRDRYPETHRAARYRRRALARGAVVGAVPPEVMRWRGLPCVYCGDPAASIDHVVPLCRGGPHAEWNLAPACTPCQSSKGWLTAFEWAAGVARTKLLLPTAALGTWTFIPCRVLEKYETRPVRHAA